MSIYHQIGFIKRARARGFSVRDSVRLVKSAGGLGPTPSLGASRGLGLGGGGWNFPTQAQRVQTEVSRIGVPGAAGAEQAYNQRMAANPVARNMNTTQRMQTAGQSYTNGGREIAREQPQSNNYEQWHPSSVQPGAMEARLPTANRNNWGDSAFSTASRPQAQQGQAHIADENGPSPEYGYVGQQQQQQQVAQSTPQLQSEDHQTYPLGHGGNQSHSIQQASYTTTTPNYFNSPHPGVGGTNEGDLTSFQGGSPSTGKWDTHAESEVGNNIRDVNTLNTLPAQPNGQPTAPVASQQMPPQTTAQPQQIRPQPTRQSQAGSNGMPNFSAQQLWSQYHGAGQTFDPHSRMDRNKLQQMQQGWSPSHSRLGTLPPTRQGNRNSMGLGNNPAPLPQA